MVSKSLEERRANPYHMSEEDRARLLVMTGEEIEAASLAIPDNPLWTNVELKSRTRARRPAGGGGQAERVMGEPLLPKVPVQLVVAKREAEKRQVSVRRLGSQASTRWACKGVN